MIYYVGQRQHMEHYCRENGINPRDRSAICHVVEPWAVTGRVIRDGDTIQAGPYISETQWDALADLRYRFKVYRVEFKVNGVEV